VKKSKEEDLKKLGKELHKALGDLIDCGEALRVRPDYIGDDLLVRTSIAIEMCTHLWIKSLRKMVEGAKGVLGKDGVKLDDDDNIIFYEA